MKDGETPLPKEMFDVPIGEMIRSMAMAVADAQTALDRTAMEQAELMGGQYILRDPKTGKTVDADGNETEEAVVVDSRVYFGFHTEDGKRVPTRVSMMELGFIPNFYQFVDTVIEVKLAFRVNATGKTRGTRRYDVIGSPVDASYASTYNYNIEGASIFKTKLTPIPPPSALEERIQNLIDQTRIEELAGPEDAKVAPTTMAIEDPGKPEKPREEAAPPEEAGAREKADVTDQTEKSGESETPKDSSPEA